jgi:nitrilase
MVKVAAVHAAPVFMDRDATLRKLDGLVAEASRNGARLVAFGESFVPGFPVWCLIVRPVDQHGLFARLRANALDVPGPATRFLAEVAARHDVYLSVGVTERSPASVGGLFNTNLLFGPDGSLRGHHRKLVATWAERLVWAHGDGAGLKCVETDFGNVGALICGENTNPLARYALMAQGEVVHIATWPPAWPFRRGAAPTDYRRWVEIRSAAHSFEAKAFTVSAASVLDEDAVRIATEGDEGAEKVLREAPPAPSLVVDPDGRVVAASPANEDGRGEDIVYADCDTNACVTAKMAHDVVCGYQRLDVFDVRLNTHRQAPLQMVGDNIGRDGYEMEPEGNDGHADHPPDSGTAQG